MYIITQYGSIVYIGIAMVFVFSPYIRKFSSYFHTRQNQAYSQIFTLISPFTTRVLVLIGRTHRLEHPCATDTCMCKFLQLRHP